MAKRKSIIRWRWFRRYHKVHYGVNGMFCSFCGSGYSYDATRTARYVEWCEFHRTTGL